MCVCVYVCVCVCVCLLKNYLEKKNHFVSAIDINHRQNNFVTIIVHFKRLGSRVSYDSFNQYVLFFSKQCTYCKTNAIYT